MENGNTFIKMPHTKIQHVAQILGLSLPTVRKALRGDSTVEKYESIRKVALENGGIELKPIQKN